MSKFLTLLLILLLGVFSLGAIQIRTPNTQTVDKLLESSISGLILDYSIADLNTESVYTANGGFTRLEIDGYLWQTAVGKPATPMLRRIIAVPRGAEIETQIVRSSTKYLSMKELGLSEPVYPAQPEYAKIEDLAMQDFAYDLQFYQSQTESLSPKNKTDISPADVVRITELGTMRNIRLVAVDFLPVQYYPVSGELLFSHNLRLQIRFLGGVDPSRDQLALRHYSPAFAPLLSRAVINYDTFDIRDSLLRQPVSYLILTPPSFVPYLQPFIQWKIQEGYQVVTKTVGSGADIANNSTAIKNYLQQVWDTATVDNPSFSYVLLVGDTPQITYSASYEYKNSGVMYQTDRNYFLLEGGDSMPEMYWGRLSATNSSDLSAIVAKTIQYQKMSMANLSYLDNAALIAGPDYDNGIPQNTPITNNQVLYGTQYFNETNGFDTMAWYSPSSDGAASQIISRINQGNALVSYTGHGLENRWDGPVISSTGSNINKPGIVIGNACLTSTINSSTSYGESWLRNSTGGAVAYIGASCYSIWTPDFYWSVGTHGMTYAPGGDGVYDALFHNHGQDYSDWANSVGAMVFLGNLAVMAGASDWSSYYWAIYNVVGDPSTIPYMGVPELNPAVFASEMVTGASMDFIVSSAAPYSRVTVHREGQNISGLTDAEGELVLDLTPFTDPGLARLTITCQGYLPVSQEIAILNPMPYPRLSSYRVTEFTDNLVPPGEAFSLNLSLRNFGNQSTGVLTLELSSSDPYLLINDGYYSVSNIGINEQLELGHVFDLELLSHAPNGHSVIMQISLGYPGASVYPLTITVIRPPAYPWVAVEEDFEAGQTNNQPIIGWQQVQISGLNQWLGDSSQGYLAGFCASLQGISSAWIYKAVELTGGKPYKVRFRYKTTTATSTNYRILFAAHSSPPTSSTTWGTELYNANVATTSWQLYNGTATYTPSASGTYYFGFRGNLINFTTNYIYVDNIEVLYEEDLGVQTIAVSPDDVLAPESVTITATVKNFLIPVQNKIVNFYGDAEFLGSQTITQVNQNATTSVFLTVPGIPGSCQYRVELPEDTVPANNTLGASYYVFSEQCGIESFETGLQFPESWNYDDPWMVKDTSTNRYHGNYYIVFNNNNLAYTDKRVYTAVLFRQAEDRLRFYYKTYNSPNTRIQYSLNGTNWITLRQLPNVGQNWTKHEILASELPTPHTGVWYIALCSTTTAGYHYTFADKFIYEAANTAAPSLSLLPTGVDFGPTDVGTSSQTEFLTIANTGGGQLTIGSIAFGPNSSFALDPQGLPQLPLILYQEDELTLGMLFNPQVHGVINDTLVISSSLGNYILPVSGWGWLNPQLQVFSGELEFPDTEIGSVRVEQLTFYNSGDGNVTVSAGDIHLAYSRLGIDSTRDPEAFTLVDNNIYPLSLSYQQHDSVSIVFSPNQSLEYSSAVVFEVDGQDPLNIPVSGKGVTGHIELDIPQLSISRMEDLLTLSWPLVTSATAYRIEYACNPHGTFQPVVNPQIIIEGSHAYCSVSTETKMFFRVVAIR